MRLPGIGGSGNPESANTRRVNGASPQASVGRMSGTAVVSRNSIGTAAGPSASGLALAAMNTTGSPGHDRLPEHGRHVSFRDQQQVQFGAGQRALQIGDRSRAEHDLVLGRRRAGRRLAR